MLVFSGGGRTDFRHDVASVHDVRLCADTPACRSGYSVNAQLSVTLVTQTALIPDHTWAVARTVTRSKLGSARCPLRPRWRERQRNSDRLAQDCFVSKLEMAAGNFDRPS